MSDELDMPCGLCGDPIGDHPMRLWMEHTRGGVHLPYETIPPSQLSQQFGLDCPIVDFVEVRSMATTPHPHLGPLAILEMTWQLGNSITGPTEVSKIAFLSDVDGMRRLGRLIRDSSNGAANAAERGAHL